MHVSAMGVSKVSTILAAGCRACMLLRIVAPSFVTITSPFEVWIYFKNYHLIVLTEVG